MGVAGRCRWVWQGGVDECGRGGVWQGRCVAGEV